MSCQNLSEIGDLPTVHLSEKVPWNRSWFKRHNISYPEYLTYELISATKPLRYRGNVQIDKEQDLSILLKKKLTKQTTRRSNKKKSFLFGTSNHR